MGKELIIKGADFSENALDVKSLETTLIQGIIVTRSSSSSYGMIRLNTASVSDKAILTKIRIPSGKKAVVEVLDNDTKMTDLKVSLNASPNDIALTDENVLTNITVNVPDFTNDGRLTDGSFEFQNTTNQDLYYYINFGYSLTTVISVANKTAYYKILNV